MKLSRFLLFGVALLIGAFAFATPTLLTPHTVETEAILPALAAGILVAAGVASLAWLLVNELVGLAQEDAPSLARPARFVLPQTGTPEVTAFA